MPARFKFTYSAVAQLVRAPKPVFQIFAHFGEPAEKWLPLDKGRCWFEPNLRSDMKIFFLDDDKERHRRFMQSRIGQDITQAWNYEEAVKLLSEQVFDIAYLDHDLSFEAAAGIAPSDEKTGTDVADFIAAMRPKSVIVHSFNPYGAKRIESIIVRSGIPCRCIPFSG